MARPTLLRFGLALAGFAPRFGAFCAPRIGNPSIDRSVCLIFVCANWPIFFLGFGGEKSVLLAPSRQRTRARRRREESTRGRPGKLLLPPIRPPPPRPRMGSSSTAATFADYSTYATGCPARRRRIDSWASAIVWRGGPTWWRRAPASAGIRERTVRVSACRSAGMRQSGQQTGCEAWDVSKVLGSVIKVGIESFLSKSSWKLGLLVSETCECGMIFRNSASKWLGWGRIVCAAAGLCRLCRVGRA